MGNHGIKFGVQLINLLTKNFISLGLGHYEALYKALQVAFGLCRWLLGRWVVGLTVLKTKGLRLRGIGWQGIIIMVGEIGMISPTRIVCV